MLFTEPIFHAKEVLKEIEKHHFAAYFVGGCVRDLLLQQEIGDIDIATSAPPEAVKKIFNHVIPVGIEHGTVIVRYQNRSYEVTTFRVEGNYSDQRHPDKVQFIDTIDEDLRRRDFTINAMAMDKDGGIIDLFSGRHDLENKIIRTVGNGYDRFTEDPLRIIRALRFSSQLGFSIDAKTLKAMEDVKVEIENIAVERIYHEMTKFFSGNFLQTGLHYLKKTAIYYHLPIFMKKPSMIQHLPENLRPIQSFGAVIALFYVQDSSVKIDEWVKKWKCSNKIKRDAAVLTDCLTCFKQNGLNRWLVYTLPPAHYEDFIALVDMLFKTTLSRSTIEQIANTLPIQSKKELKIDGHILRGLFPERKSGPWIRKILETVEQEVVSGKLMNNEHDIKDWIKWNPHATN